MCNWSCGRMYVSVWRSGYIKRFLIALPNFINQSGLVRYSMSDDPHSNVHSCVKYFLRLQVKRKVAWSDCIGPWKINRFIRPNLSFVVTLTFLTSTTYLLTNLRWDASACSHWNGDSLLMRLIVGYVVLAKLLHSWINCWLINLSRNSW